MSYFKKNRLLGPSPMLRRSQSAPTSSYYPPPPEAPTAPSRQYNIEPARRYEPVQRHSGERHPDGRQGPPKKAYNKSNTFSFGLVLLGIVALGYFFGMKKRPMFNPARIQ